MRVFGQRGPLRAACLMGLAAALAGVSGDARALSFTAPLAVEFDDGLVGTYGSVFVEEIAGGDLRFTITLGSALGSDRDLHHLYFNLVDGLDASGLAIADFVCDGGGCGSDFELLADPSVRGGAGSGFDYGVSFGNGAGARGNGTLASASFVLGADAALALVALDESSETSAGIEALFAAHVQSTSLVHRADSETVGAPPVSIPIPEPGTAALFGLGLLGLTLSGMRPRG